MTPRTGLLTVLGSCPGGRETDEGGACCACANADDPATEPVAIFVAPADGSVPAVIFVALTDAMPLKPAEVSAAFVSGSDPELGAIFVAPADGPVPAVIFVALADATPLKSAEVFVAFASGSDPELGAIFVAPTDDPVPAVIFVALADAMSLKPAEVFVAFVSGSDPELGAIFVAVTTELFAGAPFTIGRSDGLRACNVCEICIEQRALP